MLKLCRVTKVKVLFLVLVYVFNFNLFEFSAAILDKGLLYVLKIYLYFLKDARDVELMISELRVLKKLWAWANMVQSQLTLPKCSELTFLTQSFVFGDRRRQRYCKPKENACLVLKPIFFFRKRMLLNLVREIGVTYYSCTIEETHFNRL